MASASPGTRRRTEPRPPPVVHLRRARDAMDARFAQPWTVAELAAVAGCSRAHFIRAFRAAYGETPARYLNRRRIERAADLLRSVNVTVTEVCTLVGFGSLGTFSRRFRELMGHSPTEYRALMAPGPRIPGCFLMMNTRPSPSTQPGTLG